MEGTLPMRWSVKRYPIGVPEHPCRSQVGFRAIRRLWRPVHSQIPEEPAGPNTPQAPRLRVLHPGSLPFAGAPTVGTMQQPCRRICTGLPMWSTMRGVRPARLTVSAATDRDGIPNPRVRHPERSAPRENRPASFGCPWQDPRRLDLPQAFAGRIDEECAPIFPPVSVETDVLPPI